MPQKKGYLLPVIPQKLWHVVNRQEKVSSMSRFTAHAVLIWTGFISIYIVCAVLGLQAGKKTTTKQLVFTNKPTFCNRGREWSVKSAALVFDGDEQNLQTLAWHRISEQFTYLSIYKWLKVHFTRTVVIQSLKKHNNIPHKPAILCQFSCIT